MVARPDPMVRMSDRYRRQGVIGRVARLGPLFHRERPFALAAQQTRSALISPIVARAKFETLPQA
jgi:hypothetical protein